MDEQQAIEILSTTYKDGITAIADLKEAEDGSYYGVFEDEVDGSLTKRYAFKIVPGDTEDDDVDIQYRAMNQLDIKNYAAEDIDDVDVFISEGLRDEALMRENEQLKAQVAQLQKNAQKGASSSGFAQKLQERLKKKKVKASRS